MESLSSTKAKIGLIGLGLMGRPMGMNLLKAGHPLTVWNRTASRADELVAAGATLAKSPQRSGGGRRCPDHDGERSSGARGSALGLEGERGDAGVAESDAALPALKSGSIYIDSSTVSPDLARKIAAACAAKGRALSGRSGNRRRLGREEGRACFYDWRRSGNTEGRRADTGSDGQAVVSSRAQRRGSNDQAGDELDIGTAGGSPGRSACAGHGCGAQRRRSGRSHAVEHGAVRAFWT